MAEADARAREGQVLAGKYLLEKLLGEGGMGAVYRASNQLIGRTVAIKVLHDDLASKPDVVARFLQEARAANLVRHVNVVDVLDIGQDERGSPFIVQEFLHGEDFSKLLERGAGKLAVAVAMEVLLPVIDAVALAHSRGVVHRDLKPDNIFLAKPEAGGTFTPKLLDFGISQMASAPADARLTQPGTAMGTPAYMSPEQVLAKREIDSRTDVWSLGVILYESLSGGMPFDADNPSAYMVAVATAEPRQLALLSPLLSPELVRVVMRCLRRDPEHRYPSAAELARDLRLATAGIEPETTGQRAAVQMSDAALERGSHPQLAAMARASNPEWSPPELNASPKSLSLPDLASSPRPLTLPDIDTSGKTQLAAPVGAFRPLSLPDILGAAPSAPTFSATSPAPQVGRKTGRHTGRQTVPELGAPSADLHLPQLDLPAHEIAEAVAVRQRMEAGHAPPAPEQPGAALLDIKARPVDLDLRPEPPSSSSLLSSRDAMPARSPAARVVRTRPKRPTYGIRSMAVYCGLIGGAAIGLIHLGRIVDVSDMMVGFLVQWAELSFGWIRMLFAALWLGAVIVTGYYASIYRPRHHGLLLAALGATGVVVFEGLASVSLMNSDGGDRALGVPRWALLTFAVYPAGLALHQAMLGWERFTKDQEPKGAVVRGALAAVLLAGAIELATLREEPSRGIREPTVKEHVREGHARPLLPRPTKAEPAPSATPHP